MDEWSRLLSGCSPKKWTQGSNPCLPVANQPAWRKTKPVDYYFPAVAMPPDLTGVPRPQVIIANSGMIATTRPNAHTR